MADSSVTWDLIARDKASHTVGRVGDSVDSLTKRVGHLAAAFGGAFALQRAGEFALTMADQFELSRSRVETVTKNLGGSFNVVSGQVDSLDKRLAAFGFTNADVEGSVASLETATKNVPKALKDVGLATDIARGRNISLEEATRILMRVETGHVAMLSKLGIATKDANGHLLTQRQALQALATTYGGSASHFADTFAGKQQALRAELGNSAAEIGVALLPAFVDLARVLQHDVLPPIQSAAEFFDRNRKTIEPLVGVVLKLALAWKAYNVAVRLAGELGALGGAGRVAGAAAAAPSALGRAFSMANPLPVYVVNNVPGGGVPPVIGPGGKGPSEPLSRFPAGLRALPLYALGAIPDRQSSVSDRQVAMLRVEEAALAHINQLRRASGMADVSTQRFFDALSRAGAGDHGMKATADQIQRVVRGFTAGTSAASKFTASTQAAAHSVADQVKALANAQARTLALAGAEDSLREAIHGMAVSAAASGTTLRGNSDAAISNRQALSGAVKAAEDYIQTLKDQHANGQKVYATELAVAKAILANADATFKNRGEVVALLKQLHFLPSQVEAAFSDTYAIGYNAMARVANGFIDAGYNAQQAIALESAQLNKQLRLAGDPHGAGAANYIAPPPAHIAYKTTGAGLGGDFVGGYTQVVSPGIGNATTKAVDSALDKAKQRMQAHLSTWKQFFAQQRQTLISGFETLSTEQTQDALGAPGPPKSLLSQLRADRARMHEFVSLYIRLDRRGLDQHLLSLFQGLGPEAIPEMRQLLHTRGGIAAANRLDRGIQRDATRLAGRETQDIYGKQMSQDIHWLRHHGFHGLERSLTRSLRHMHVNVSVVLRRPRK